MKTAKEMFEELGYIEQFYENSDIYKNKNDGSRIAFDSFQGGTIDVVELNFLSLDLL